MTEKMTGALAYAEWLRASVLPDAGVQLNGTEVRLIDLADEVMRLSEEVRQSDIGAADLRLLLSAARDAHASTKAAYDEAQLTIAGLTAERDEYQKRAGVPNRLYDAIVTKLRKYYPIDSRDLEWDVLPSTLEHAHRVRSVFMLRWKAAKDQLDALYASPEVWDEYGDGWRTAIDRAEQMMLTLESELTV